MTFTFAVLRLIIAAAPLWFLIVWALWPRFNAAERRIRSLRPLSNGRRPR